MNKIIVIGSSNTDMVIKADKLPAPGETVLGGQFIMNPGGKGANQAVAAARMGVNPVFVCKVGDDVFGHTAIEQFKTEGMNTDYVFIDFENPSGVALISVDARGENSINVAPGANAALNKADIDKIAPIFNKNDILLIQLETPIDTVEYAIDVAYQKGLKVILNPAPAARVSDAVLKCLFAITPNETETEILTSIKVTDIASAAAAAQIFMEKGVQNVIITMGSQGAFVKSAAFEGLVPTTKVNATDTTAAGDCFNGAFAVCVLEEKSLDEAVAMACKAASISVTRIGAQASMPTRDEIL